MGVDGSLAMLTAIAVTSRRVASSLLDRSLSTVRMPPANTTTAMTTSCSTNTWPATLSGRFEDNAIPSCNTSDVNEMNV
jgi:hypothetical protein